MKVYKLNSPAFDYAAFQEFLEDEETSWNPTSGAKDGESLVEATGRLCYMSFGKKQFRQTNEEFVGHLISQGHESVLEHATWTFILTGISRAFSHQLVRHRIGFSYSQLSQQYHDESDARFLVPAAIANNENALSHWQKSVDAARSAYRAILDENPIRPRPWSDEDREITRRIRSDARSVLPNATETKIVVTANARSLRHFFELRGATLGDIECRCVSFALFESVLEDAPSLFQDFEADLLPDGFPIVRKLRKESKEPEKNT